VGGGVVSVAGDKMDATPALHVKDLPAVSTSQPIDQVRWEPLKEVVYRQLRDAILAAKYPPGTALTVRATAEAMGVSPMPVRSAFDRLGADRAVEATPSTGTVRIPQLSRRRFAELVEMRKLLEGTAAEKAAARARPADVEKLGDIARGLADAVAANDGARYLLLNREFKFAVYRLADSATLLDLIERVWLQVGPFMHFYGTGIAEQGDTDEYDGIVAALASHDGAAAKDATVRDIAGGEQFLLVAGVFVD
jgi:DNA-binding GntR family transcriptional regulator